MAVPAPGNDDVGDEGGDVEGTDYIHEGCEVEDHVEDDSSGGDERIDKDGEAEMRPV